MTSMYLMNVFVIWPSTLPHQMSERAPRNVESLSKESKSDASNMATKPFFAKRPEILWIPLLFEFIQGSHSTESFSKFWWSPFRWAMNVLFRAQTDRGAPFAVTGTKFVFAKSYNVLLGHFLIIGVLQRDSSWILHTCILTIRSHEVSIQTEPNILKILRIRTTLEAF